MAFCIASTARVVSSISVCPNRRVLLMSKRPTNRISVQKSVQCIASSEINASTAARRSANYQPCIWDEDHLLSLTNEYMEDTYRKKAEKLTEQLRMMINNADQDNPLKQLELVDNLQRLGLAYHFENEIGNILNNVHKNSDDKWKKGNLYATSLEFRLLRQHSYNISEEVFNGFKDATGDFKECLGDDIKATLGFYDASLYGLEGERIMEEAWQCTSKYLKELDMKDMEPNMALHVKHALDLPLHWRPPRADTRWFIDFYETREDKNHLLLDLAKLDFNIVQAIHQEDLKDTMRWWRDTGLGNLSFVRNRLVTSYFWAVGIAHQPQYSYTRKIIAEAIALITVIDDIYDVYGTLPELELLTDTIKRWDIKAMKQLPSYMKTTYLVLYNFANEMAYHILKEQDSDVTEHLMKIWEDIAEAQIVEARWFHSQYKTTLEEYLQNAYVSITGPAISTLAYLSATDPIVEKEVELIESHTPLVKLASKAFRVQDDLGTATRGDVFKAVQCYMNETGCSEEAGREHIQQLTRQWWKKLNLLRTTENSPIPKNITEMILNLLRTSHLVYLHGEDGHGVEGQAIMNAMTSLLLQPIP